MIKLRILAACYLGYCTLGLATDFDGEIPIISASSISARTLTKDEKIYKEL